MKNLVYYGGQGLSYSKEIGVYEVRTEIKKRFNRLSEAKEYYDSLSEEKALWDLAKIPELLECHTLNNNFE